MASTSSVISSSDNHLLLAILDILSVFFQQDIGIIPADVFSRGNEVLFCFQLLDDFHSGLIIWLSVFSVHFGQDFVQAENPHL